MTIITITIEAPFWGAGKVRDAILPTLLHSTELTVGEGWSWRTPLTWRFTVTGPAFQVHKVAGDVQTAGIVRYPRVAYAALVLAMLSGPAAAGCNCSRTESAGGMATASGNQTATWEAMRNRAKGRMRTIALGIQGKVTTFTPYVSSGDNVLGTSDQFSVGVINLNGSLRERAVIDTAEGTWRGMEDHTGRLYGGT